MAAGELGSNPWTVTAAIFQHGQVLFSRSDGDLARFHQLQKQTTRQSITNVVEAARGFKDLYSFVGWMQAAMERGDLPSARWIAWRLINATVAQLSLVNDTPLRTNWGKNITEVIHLLARPEHYEELVKILATSDSMQEMVIAGKELLARVRDIVLARQRTVPDPSISPEYFPRSQVLAIREYIGKILSACNKRDMLAVSYAAAELQVWIAQDVAIMKDGCSYDVYNFNFFDEIAAHYREAAFPDLSPYIAKMDFDGLRRAAITFRSRLDELCTDKLDGILVFEDVEALKVHFSGLKG